MSGCRVAAASVRTGRFEARRIGDLGRPRSAADRVREQLIAERLPHAGLGQAGCPKLIPERLLVPAKPGLLQAAERGVDPHRADTDPESLCLERQVLAIGQQCCRGVRSALSLVLIQLLHELD